MKRLLKALHESSTEKAETAFAVVVGLWGIP